MKLNKITQIIIALSILLIAISIGYYFFIFLPEKENTRLKNEKQEQAISVRNNCTDKVIKEMKDAHPAMETDEITNYRIAHDRGCFIEAGGMNDVKDDYFKTKFDEYNDAYYKNCYAEVLKKVDKMVDEEKTKRIDECIELYSE